LDSEDLITEAFGSWGVGFCTLDAEAFESVDMAAIECLDGEEWEGWEDGRWRRRSWGERTSAILTREEQSVQITYSRVQQSTIKNEDENNEGEESV
jgi:hypothetical protein